MDHELKSFKRDWDRWSTAERATVLVVFAFAAAAAIFSTLTNIPV